MSVTLLTGLPRSGTSLVCACLNTAPNCLALVEPMSVPAHGDPARAVTEIAAFCAATRATVLRTGQAKSANVDGKIVDNTFEPVGRQGERRRSQTHVGDVTITQPLDENFRLFVKHPAMFSALAAPLSCVLPLFAVVRHPLAALASWQTVDIPLGRGRMPAAEAFSPELAARLDREVDTLSRQITLIRWFFETYAKLPPTSILTYEAIVADASAALAGLTGRSVRITHRIEHHDIRRRYPGVDFQQLARVLLHAEPEVSVFYPDFRAELDIWLRR